LAQVSLIKGNQDGKPKVLESLLSRVILHEGKILHGG